MSEYRVGAARANGCASPVRIWPNITTPKLPPSGSTLCDPAKRTQLPTRTRAAEVMMEGLGPRWRTLMTTGAMKAKESIKAVESQFMVVWLTRK